MGSACVCQKAGGASEINDLDDSDMSLEKAREFADQRDYTQSVQYYNEALRLRVKYFGLDENTETSLKRRKSRVLERRLSAVKVALVFSKMLDGKRKNSEAEALEGSQTPPAEENQGDVVTPAQSKLTPPLSERQTSAAKYVTDAPEGEHTEGETRSKSAPPPPAAPPGGAPRNAIEFLKNKSAFVPKQKQTVQAAAAAFAKKKKLTDVDTVKRMVIGSSTISSEIADVSEADILHSVPYHFSHVQLLVEIGNFHLSFGRIHFAFFYFVQTLSIVAPIIRTKKPPEDVGSALLLYVDAALGLCIVYINCLKSDVLQTLHSTFDEQATSVTEIFQLPQKTMRKLSLSPVKGGGAASREGATDRFGNSVASSSSGDFAAASGGLNATTLVRSSIAKMITLLDGSHPLDLAERQAHTAIQRVQQVDGPRSSLLVALMHVKCHVQLHRGHKRLALHTMQRALGMTYCRSGASDALKLSLYSHKVLDYIKAEIRKEEQALTGASDLCSPLQRGDSLVAENALASTLVGASNVRTAHEDEQLLLLQQHLPPSNNSDFTDIKRVSSIRIDHQPEPFGCLNDSLQRSHNSPDNTSPPDDNDCDLWFSGCKRANSDGAAAAAAASSSSPSKHHNTAWGGDDSRNITDDRMLRQIASFLLSLGSVAGSCGATPSHSPPLAKHGSMSESSGRGLSFQSASSAQAAINAFTAKPPVPQNISFPPPPQPPPQHEDERSATPPGVITEEQVKTTTSPRRFVVSGDRTPPPSASRRSLTAVSSEERDGSSSSLTNNGATNSGMFLPPPVVRSPSGKSALLQEQQQQSESTMQNAEPTKEADDSAAAQAQVNLQSNEDDTIVTSCRSVPIAAGS